MFADPSILFLIQHLSVHLWCDTDTLVRKCWERLNICDCYMKSCLSSLVLSSSFMDLVVRKRKGWSRSQRKLCCSVSLLPWGLRIVDIKLSEIIGTIWCVLVFSTKVNYIPLSWCELGTHVTSPRQKWNSPPQGKPYMSNSPLSRDNQWSNT